MQVDYQLREDLLLLCFEVYSGRCLDGDELSLKVSVESSSLRCCASFSFDFYVPEQECYSSRFLRVDFLRTDYEDTDLQDFREFVSAVRYQRGLLKKRCIDNEVYV